MEGLDMFWGGAPKPLNRDSITGGELELARNRDDEAESDLEYYNPQTGETAAPRKRDAPGISKSLRVPGGVPATAKKITANYDSDDARIIELKRQGFSDEYVADKLQQEGRMRYVAKTIGSRWLRLRKVLDDKEDDRLDDELSDWHVGEDELMADIKAEVEKKYEVQFKRLRDKIWKEISIYFADKLGKRKYTAKACYERFEALQAGTALLPIELDGDQVGRRQMREERIAKSKADRAANEKVMEDAEAQKKAELEARKKLKEEMIVKRREDSARKSRERRERERNKHEREANRLRMKQERMVRQADSRLQRDWMQRKWRAEKLLYKQYSGKAVPGPTEEGARTETTADGHETDDGGDGEEDLDGMVGSAELEAQVADDENDADGERDHAIAPPRDAATPSPSGDPPTARRHAHAARKAGGKARARTRDHGSSEPLPAAVETVFNKAPVSKESLLNPRSIMSLDELAHCLSRRSHPRPHPSESHAEVVARLAHVDKELNISEINELLRGGASGPMKAKKDDKIQALQAYEAAISEKGSAGYKSTDLEFMRTYEGYRGQWAYLLDEHEAGQREEAGRREDADAMDVE